MFSHYLQVSSLIRYFASLAIVTMFVAPGDAAADGYAVDKVYLPYVQPLEREIELRSLYLDDHSETIDGGMTHRLGIGKSFSDRLFGEFYLIGQKDFSGDSVSLEAYELELKWQLTEQGERFADWGILFELESERDVDILE